jgi:hypothetical protein
VVVFVIELERFELEGNGTRAMLDGVRYASFETVREERTGAYDIGEIISKNRESASLQNKKYEV